MAAREGFAGARTHVSVASGCYTTMRLRCAFPVLLIGPRWMHRPLECFRQTTPE